MEDNRKGYRKLAKECKQRYKKIISLCNYYQSKISIYHESIIDLIDKRVHEELMTVPVEALNFNSARIRTSALRTAGYNSVGEIVDKSMFSLANVYGIGEASIERIKVNAEIIYKKHLDNLEIKANIRSRADKHVEVVTIVAAYRHAIFKKDQFNELRKYYLKEYSSSVEKILSLTNPIRWLFISKDKKLDGLAIAKDIVEKRCLPFLDETKVAEEPFLKRNEIYLLYKDKIDELNEAVSKEWSCIKFVDETVQRMMTPSNVKTGYNVTGICKITPQPKGGFINLRSFEKKEYCDQYILSPEQIGAGTIGTVVDYLTRMHLGCGDKRDAFQISLDGAMLMRDGRIAEQLLNNIEKDLSDESIRNAALLVGYDATYRAGYPYHADPYFKIDVETLNNIRILVNRSANFFKNCGKNIDAGLTFVGGYTKRVSSGDADYMVDDTIWDLKTSKAEPDKNQTLQVLIYYLLAKHSGQPKYEKLKSIGIYNARLNVSYKIDIEKIDKNIIKTVEKEVVGY